MSSRRQSLLPVIAILMMIGCTDRNPAGADGTITPTGDNGVTGDKGGATGDGVVAKKDGGGSTGDVGALGKFSFFVTSLKALRDLSKNQNGFGGDLSYGETGAGAGLRGADKICTEIAERSMAGAGKKVWRAFLSATNDGSGKVANAIDRIGSGPWYDRQGRLFGKSIVDISATRPTSADAAIKNDFPNEDGVPNHSPDGVQVDNHDMLTGSNAQGKLYGQSATCKDWTGKAGSEGKPRVGHSWPRGGGGGGGGGEAAHWISAMDVGGCAPGVNLSDSMGGGGNTVGGEGGYGGFYCFALTP